MRLSAGRLANAVARRARSCTVTRSPALRSAKVSGSLAGLADDAGSAERELRAGRAGQGLLRLRAGLRLRDPDCDAWILEHETERVVYESGPEVEGWREVVVAGTFAVIRQARVALLEPLDCEVSSAHVDSRSVDGLTHLKPESTHGECVRASGCFEVDVQAAAEIRHRAAVDEPPAGAVPLEAMLVLSDRRPPEDMS